MKRIVCLVILLFAMMLIDHQAESAEIFIEAANVMNVSEVPGVYKVNSLRVKKVNRTTTLLNLDVDILVDLDNEYAVSHILLIIKPVKAFIPFSCCVARRFKLTSTTVGLGTISG